MRPPPYFDITQRELDAWVVWWLTEVPEVSDGAALVADALRASSAPAATTTFYGTVPWDDDLELAAKQIDPGAVVECIDGAMVVVMPTAEGHAAFSEWCSSNVEWD